MRRVLCTWLVVGGAVGCGPAITLPGDEASAGSEDGSSTGAMTSVGPGSLGDSSGGATTTGDDATTGVADTSDTGDTIEPVTSGTGTTDTGPVVPPVACDAFTQERECLAAGCTAFTQGRPLTDRGGGACLCDLDEPWCLFIDPGATALPGATAYVHESDDRVLVLEATWDPPPFGFVACAVHPDPPPACACADVLPCAMGGG